MRKTPEELKAAVIAQGITLAGEKYPHTTQAQRERIAVALWENLSDYTKEIEPLALNAKLNGDTITDVIAFKSPSLFREAPSADAAFAFKLADLQAQTEAPIDPSTRITLKRQIDKMSPDERLSLVPEGWKAPADVAAVNAPAQKSNTGKLSTEDIADAMSIPTYQVKASDHIRFNQAAEHVPEGTKQNAINGDHFNRIEKELGRSLTPSERIAQHRIEQARKAS